MRSESILRGEQSVAEACYEAALFLEAKGYRFEAGSRARNAPLLLAYAPSARTNPFQSLLYRRALAAGVAPIGLPSVWRLAECVWPGPRVVHLHWLSEVLKDVADEQQARARLEEFLGLLDRLRTANTTLVWTVHNALPHDCLWPEWEAELRQRVVRCVDAIHVMTPQTPLAVRPYFELERSKVFCVPHPSYAGAYPNRVSRDQARFELGLEPDAFVYLFFGALRPYKGVFDLIEAFKRLQRERVSSADRPVQLVIAGAAKDAGLRHEIDGLCSQDPHIHTASRLIEADQVQYFFNAADVCVLPYKRVLNSGVALLAQAFGKPTIVPDLPWLTGPASSDPRLSYTPGDVQSLCEALGRAMDAGPSLRSAFAAARAQRHCDVSDTFLAHLRRVVSVGRGTEQLGSEGQRLPLAAPEATAVA